MDREWLKQKVMCQRKNEMWLRSNTGKRGECGPFKLALILRLEGKTFLKFLTFVASFVCQ